MAPPVLLDTCALYMMDQNGWLPDDYIFDREETNADDAVAEFDALLRQSTPRLKGTPYVFDRADAYDPETPANSPAPSKPLFPSKDSNPTSFPLGWCSFPAALLKNSCSPTRSPRPPSEWGVLSAPGGVLQPACIPPPSSAASPPSTFYLHQRGKMEKDAPCWDGWSAPATINLYLERKNVTTITTSRFVATAKARDSLKVETERFLVAALVLSDSWNQGLIQIENTPP